MAKPTQQDGGIVLPEPPPNPSPLPSAGARGNSFQASVNGFRCESCGDVFSSGDDLNKHKALCSGEPFCLCHHLEHRHLVSSP